MQTRTILKIQGWLLSAACIGYVLWSLDWSEMLNILPRISLLDIVVLSTIYVSGFLVRGLRWHILLPGLGLKTATSGVVLGYAANNILPARLGEFVRAQIVGTHAKIPRSTTFATIMIERIFDGFIIVLLLIAATDSISLPEWARSFRLFGLVLFSTLLAGSWIAGTFGEQILSYLPEIKGKEFVRNLVVGAALGSRTLVVWFSLLLTSIIVWSIEGAMFVYALHVLELPIEWIAAYFVLGVVNLGILIPNSPGNVGVFQYFTILALSVFGVSTTEAAAYSFLVHFCQFMPITILGFTLLPLFGASSFAGFRRQQDAQTSAASLS